VIGVIWSSSVLRLRMDISYSCLTWFLLNLGFDQGVWTEIEPLDEPRFHKPLGTVRKLPKLRSGSGVLESGNMFVFRTMILGPVASSKRGVSHEIGSPTHLSIFSATGADRD
jgi:hypothetical protein